MNFEIFTFGDPQLLKTILDAVIMILTAGGLGGGAAIGIAMSVGILVVGVGTLVTGKPDFNKFIMAFIVWFFLVGFSYGSHDGQKIDVVITGADGSVAIVTDAPPGLMWFYSVLTKVGFELQDLFMDVFSMPNRIPSGSSSGSPLVVPTDPYVALMKLRDAQFSAFMTDNAEFEGVKASFKQFTIDCIETPAMALGKEVNLDALDYGDLFAGTAQVNEGAFQTTLYFGLSGDVAFNTGPYDYDNPAFIRCDTARAELSAKLISTDFTDLLTEDLRVNGRVDMSSATSLLNSVTTLSRTQADYTGSLFYKHILAEMATEEKVSGGRTFTAMQVLGEETRWRAMQDRRLKQAQERSFNMETWTMIINVVEIFTYFITAFMPFMILISGGYLIKMVLSWLTIIVWVNLLPITYVISKVYTEYYTGFAERCADSALACPSFSSIGAIDASYTTIETALAMSGTINAVIPSLTFFLLSGSAYSLMSSMGSMSPKASPDTSGMNPKNTGSWNSAGTVHESRMGTSVATQDGTRNFSNSLDKAPQGSVRSSTHQTGENVAQSTAYDASVTSAANVANATQTAINNNKGVTTNGMDVSTQTAADMNTHTKARENLKANSETFKEGGKVEDSVVDSITAKASMSGSIGVGAKLFGTGVTTDVSTSAGKDEAYKQLKGMGLTSEEAAVVTESQKNMDAFSQTYNDAHQVSKTTGWNGSVAHSDSIAYNKAVTESNAAKENVQASQSVADTSTITTNFDGNKLTGDPIANFSINNGKNFNAEAMVGSVRGENAPKQYQENWNEYKDKNDFNNMNASEKVTAAHDYMEKAGVSGKYEKIVDKQNDDITNAAQLQARTTHTDERTAKMQILANAYMDQLSEQNLSIGDSNEDAASKLRTKAEMAERFSEFTPDSDSSTYNKFIESSNDKADYLDALKPNESANEARVNQTDIGRNVSSAIEETPIDKGALNVSGVDAVIAMEQEKQHNTGNNLNGVAEPDMTSQFSVGPSAQEVTDGKEKIEQGIGNVQTRNGDSEQDSIEQAKEKFLTSLNPDNKKS